MFSELNIRTTTVENDDYVCVSDLAAHLTLAMMVMTEEIKAEKDENRMDDLTYNFCVGMVHGLREAALLLAQGGIEMKLDREVHNIDDLMNFQ